MKVLDMGRQIEELSTTMNVSAVISLALLEEIELLTGCLVQLFKVADQWSALNYSLYS